MENFACVMTQAVLAIIVFDTSKGVSFLSLFTESSEVENEKVHNYDASWMYNRIVIEGRLFNEYLDS